MQQAVFLPIIDKDGLHKTRTMQIDQRQQQDHTPSPSCGDPCEQSSDLFVAGENVPCRHSSVPLTMSEANVPRDTELGCPALDGTRPPRNSIIADDNAEVTQQNQETFLRWQSSARRYARAVQQHDSELPNVYPPRYSLIMAEGFQHSNMMDLRHGTTEVRDEQLEHNISNIAPRLRGEPTHGIIQLTMRNCTDIRFLGLKVQAIDNGVFVRKVEMGSPADVAGLRFGDQILSIDRISVAGYSRQGVKKLLRRIDRSTIPLVVRDRPYERSIILQKDMPNYYGFRYLDGRIISIAKGSSAAIEGLQYDQQITSVNGKSVIGLTDQQLWNFINKYEDGVSISFVPHNIYKRITRKLSLSGMLGSAKQTLLNI